ncbi:MAG TPA: very short patch repair endonuclease [Candidatus Angelobacter sp.]|nr:very short patch repair endonuclease [Candidatus Angelobacter sp.]
MDVFSKKKRSLVMSGIRSKHNRSTEYAFIEFLRAFRITGWRLHYAIQGRPDFVFPKMKIAVFVDGCFWHRCPHCYDSHIPKQNRHYWVEKLASNKRRDNRNNRILRSLGWRVFRVRECSISKRKSALFATLAALR